MGAVDVRLGEINAAAPAQILRKPAQQTLEDTVVDPTLKPAMARLIRRVAPRQICPRRAGAQNPQNSVENCSRRRERATTATAASNPLVARNEILDRLP